MDAIRVRVRAVMADRKITMAEIARRMQLPYGTFTNWMGGTYKGRNERVAEQVLSWLNSLETQERTRAMQPRAPAFVLTKTAEAILATLEHGQYTPEMVVITGIPGVGKTSAARWHASRNPNVWMVTAEPAMSSPNALLHALNDELRVEPAGVSALRMSRSLMRKMAGSQGLILIDEAQHLTSPTLDQLRSFFDIAGVGIALMGNEHVYARLEGGARSAQYAQLFSRIGMPLRRPRVLKDDIEALLDAWGVQGAAERKLLHQIARKPGALRNVNKVVRMAHMLAGGDGAEAMGEGHIAMAWDRLSGGAALQAEAA
ncbi:AAA family ATPase [Roseomonas sp. HJA6]|uniref:AAA family ATPase n=1 Tax=Roseomonas alba TaxID=2846776 RepID=A0ABS7ACE7_9PROT|nr:AAA family ATPase [Neoroseomonas alba]MBW6399963.1 AAA family ATPase [Neoroseomonas alba]